MKGKIYLYLFVFSLLVNVFQYVNSKGIIDKYEKDIKKFKAKIEILENSNLEASLLEHFHQNNRYIKHQFQP